MGSRNTFVASSIVSVLLAGSAAWAAGPQTVDFDELPLAPDSYWVGTTADTGFSSGTVFFQNEFTDWGYGFFSWAGFGYSNVNDPSTPGYLNQFAVASGTGVGGAGNYALVYDDSFSPDTDQVVFPEPALVQGFYVNNTAYAALAMLHGEYIAKKFGGPSGTDPDWFKLEVTGRDEAGMAVGSVEHYLADYRNPDPAADYVQLEWTWLDLSALGASVKTLQFALTSTDTSPWGLNTPTYFAMDNLVWIPASDLLPPADCVRNAAFWLHNPARWLTLTAEPIFTLDLTGAHPDCPATVLTAVDALNLLQAPSKGDATIPLAQELVAAILNVTQGVDASLAEGLIDEATEFLCVVPIGSNPDGKPLKTAAKALTKRLEAFNKGKLNVPKCGSGGSGSGAGGR